MFFVFIFDTVINNHNTNLKQNDSSSSTRD